MGGDCGVGLRGGDCGVGFEGWGLSYLGTDKQGIGSVTPSRD